MTELSMAGDLMDFLHQMRPGSPTFRACLWPVNAVSNHDNQEHLDVPLSPRQLDTSRSTWSQPTDIDLPFHSETIILYTATLWPLNYVPDMGDLCLETALLRYDLPALRNWVLDYLSTPQTEQITSEAANLFSPTCLLIHLVRQLIDLSHTLDFRAIEPVYRLHHHWAEVAADLF